MIKRIKSKITAAYIAGIIDGEGTIGLYLGHRGEINSPHGRRTPTYSLRIRVRMCDKTIIDWLLSSIGGRYYSKEGNDRHRDIHDWSIVGVDAIQFLKYIYPYLRVKKRQADVALEFGKTLHALNSEGRISDEIIIKRVALREAMLSINFLHGKSRSGNCIKR